MGAPSLILYESIGIASIFHISTILAINRKNLTA